MSVRVVPGHDPVPSLQARPAPHSPGSGRTAPDTVIPGPDSHCASTARPVVDDQIAAVADQTLTPKSCAMPRRPEAYPCPMARNFHSAPLRYSSPKTMAVSVEASSLRS